MTGDTRKKRVGFLSSVPVQALPGTMPRREYVHVSSLVFPGDPLHLVQRNRRGGKVLNHLYRKACRESLKTLD